MKIESLILFLMTTFSLAAKTVTGVVVDETQQPVSFVNVVLIADSTFIDGKSLMMPGVFYLKMQTALPTKSKYQ